MLQPVYQLGPFIIKISLVIIALSMMFSYLVAKYRLKNVSSAKEILESLSNAFIISIIVWKLSYIIIYPIRTLENPLALLFFNGGSIGTMLAILSFIAILFYYAKKKAIAVAYFIDTALTGVISFFLFFNVFSAIIYAEVRLVHIIGLFVALSFILLIIKNSFPLKKVILLEIIIWWSIAQIVLEYFLNSSLPFIGPFSTQQVIYITVSIVILIILLIKRTSNN
ncbi:hypothetical protein CIB95_12775 [Lottiidibacillus patelloidae]|uniref:Prolipoprotein diacylglyceryl transferase n=1 Tax=Lottiidibacillus patelloidae TaxID=2670334 RepID=A0A263BRT9_9BACI|nr:prolipoprotein diacylglyceryl transferase [Lottiidibacillus patelloidae]OZM56288.1 hypothetical protein CIB95_12775 [Lottiidibacillus patelloidae]